jgi:hypothetical protein
MAIEAVLSFVFLFLFACYSAQLFYIRRRLLNGPLIKEVRDDLWIFLGLSLLIPIAVSFLPEIIAQALEPLLNPSMKKDSDVPLRGVAFALKVGSRLLAAYLVTVVTLELALQAQIVEARSQNPWSGLLLMNLGLDIASIVVIQLFLVIPAAQAGDVLTLIAFVFFLVPTVLTSAIVVAATYSVSRGVMLQ